MYINAYNLIKYKLMLTFLICTCILTLILHSLKTPHCVRLNTLESLIPKAESAQLQRSFMLKVPEIPTLTLLDTLAISFTSGPFSNYGKMLPRPAMNGMLNVPAPLCTITMETPALPSLDAPALQPSTLDTPADSVVFTPTTLTSPIMLEPSANPVLFKYCAGVANQIGETTQLVHSALLWTPRLIASITFNLYDPGSPVAAADRIATLINPIISSSTTDATLLLTP
jgi:hypothetical protein